LSTGVAEPFKGLEADLIQRFQAIRRKPRHRHKDALDAALGQALERSVGVRLKPFVAAKEGLKRLRPALAPPAQPPHQFPPCPLDVRGVRIAASSVADWNAVKTQDEMLRLPGKLR